MADKIARKIKRAMLKLKREELLESVERELARGVPARSILRELERGMMILGKAFERQEIFLPEALIAAEIFEGAWKKLQPKLGEMKTLGKVVVGTVGPDVHEVGKDLVAAWLRAARFEVVDVGVLVAPETLVEAVEKSGAVAVAMSLRLSTTIHAAWRVVRLLEIKGLRKKVGVIIGGPSSSPELARELGADAHASNFMEAVRWCRKQVKQRQITKP